MIQWLEAIAPAWKIGTAVAGGLLVLTLSAGPKTVAWVRGPAVENTARIEAHEVAIEQHEETLDTFRAYIVEVRCILRARVQEEDPLVCLLRNGDNGQR